MKQGDSVDLAKRVERIRAEALALSQEGESFPAMWRNAARVLACVRMMEMDLGVDGDWDEASKQTD